MRSACCCWLPVGRKQRSLKIGGTDSSVLGGGVSEAEVGKEALFCQTTGDRSAGR